MEELTVLIYYGLKGFNLISLTTDIRFYFLNWRILARLFYKFVKNFSQLYFRSLK